MVKVRWQKHKRRDALHEKYHFVSFLYNNLRGVKSRSIHRELEREILQKEKEKFDW
jgi:hypothetical protein